MAVLNDIQHLLFEIGGIDEDYVAKHVIGIDDLPKSVEKYNPKYVEEITGIPEESLAKQPRSLVPCFRLSYRAYISPVKLPQAPARSIMLICSAAALDDLAADSIK